MRARDSTFFSFRYQQSFEVSTKLTSSLELQGAHRPSRKVPINTPYLERIRHSHPMVGVKPPRFVGPLGIPPPSVSYNCSCSASHAGGSSISSNSSMLKLSGRSRLLITIPSFECVFLTTPSTGRSAERTSLSFLILLITMEEVHDQKTPFVLTVTTCLPERTDSKALPELFLHSFIRLALKGNSDSIDLRFHQL